MSRKGKKDITSILGATDRRQYQRRRSEFLTKHVDVATTRGLELGGFDLPTVPPSEGECAIADMRSEIQLSQEFETPLHEICPVDCVIEPGLAAFRQIESRFDYVILCHVLEHIPDVITMLNDLGELLVPGGVVFIALPDKRLTPDSTRDSTTISRLIERMFDRTNSPSLTEIAEFSLAWNEEYRRRYKDSMAEFYQFIRGHQLYGDPDVHCNVWRDDEFLSQLRDLIRADYVRNLEIVDTRATEEPFNEFYVVLHRPIDIASEESRDSTLTRRPIHYRTCNFCGFGKFKIWKRIHSPFPERIYADSPPSPDIGRELSLQYVTCRNCDLSSINPLPDFDSIDRKSFSVGSVLDVPPAEIDRLIESSERKIEILSDQYEFENYRQSGRLLDVSCGPGIGLSWLRDHRGWDVYGVEPAREFVDFAKDRFGIEIFNGLVQDFPESSGSFDVVVIDSSLQCTFDPLATLIACHRLLREGGCLFIQMPNRDGLGTQWADLNVHWGHWFHISPHVLYRKLEELGFQTNRILAIQTALDPRVAEIIPDDEPVSLEVALTSPAEVERYFEGEGHISADFFGLSARKLARHECAEDHDEKRESLRAVSFASHRQRICVALDPDTDVMWPWDEVASD